MCNFARFAHFMIGIYIFCKMFKMGVSSRSFLKKFSFCVRVLAEGSNVNVSMFHEFHEKLWSTSLLSLIMLTCSIF